MKLHRRVGKLELETERRRLGARAHAEFVAQGAQEEEQARCIRRVVDAEPAVVQPILTRLVELADKGAALMDRGGSLSPSECEEGEILAAELTARIRAAYAPGDAVVGGSIRFGFRPCRAGG